MGKLEQLVKNNQFNYMLLDRLRMDLDYFFGNGQLHVKHLFYEDVNVHMRAMINLWKSLPLKPEWLRATKLIEYKKKVGEFQSKK